MAYRQEKILPKKWQFGLFECFSPSSTCCLSYCCPCILYGRIHARERGEKDPSGMNCMCLAYCAMISCGMAHILQCIQRGNMQEKYGMKKNGCTNWLTAFFCGCCELIQEEKEAIVRNTGMNPKSNQPYIPPPDMKYP